MTIRAKAGDAGGGDLPPELAIAECAQVEVSLPENPRRGSLAQRLAPFVGAEGSGVGDLADKHDHYLYGAQKRTA
jgi:hypothetical protein